MTVTTRRAAGSLTALVVSHALSRTGNVVTVFAVPFTVLAQGGDAVQVGIAAAAATAPIVIGGPFGGVLVDRIGALRSSVAADLISGATIALIPITAMLGLSSFPLLVALVFLSGLLDAPGETARRIMVPGLSLEAGIPLERSVGFLDGATRASSLLGAPLAALLVATIGPFPALFATVGLFAVAAFLTAALVRPPGTGPAPTPARSGYIADLREGLRFVVTDPLLRSLVLLVLVTNALDAARSATLMPLYAAERLDGAASLGFIVAAFGGGALAGTVLFGLIAHRLPRRIPFVICFSLAGVSLCAPALGFDTFWLVVVSLVAGFAAGAINPIIGAVELERIPGPMRARVLGLITAGAWAGMPLGAALGGLAAEAWGLTTTFVVAAVIYLAATLTPLRGGPWRLMERRPSD
ncbi:MFS transporter [Microbacterium sp. GXF7504]